MPSNPEVAVETQVGIAKIWGMKDATWAIGAATIISTLDDADAKHGFKKEDLTGQDGNIETKIAWQEKIEVTINFAPKGTSRALAIAQLVASKPTMLAKVTLSGFPGGVGFGFNGDYNYVGGWNVKMTKEGPLVSGIQLEADIVNRANLTAGVLS